jgi:hypothetical protein
MKRLLSLAFAFLLLFAWSSNASMLDDVLGQKSKPAAPAEKGSDDNTTASGLKEALSVGTKNAVKSVAKTDGYFKNQAIKILMPDKIQKAADMLSKVGYKKEVDDFVLSMNRAAEKAAPKAVDIFVEAIKHMTFDDAKKVLSGGETAATDFFREKTRPKLFDEYKPVVTDSMSKVGVAQSYNKMTAGYAKLPFVHKEDVDLDDHITNKALDGLFYMVAQEEKKIRTNPAARVTDLLKKVFGK